LAVDSPAGRSVGDPVKRSPPRWAAILTAVTIAAVGVVYAAHVQATIKSPLDFDQLYAAAKFLAERRDPYRLIGPGREFNWPFQYFLYPLTSAAAIIPLTAFPLATARLVFVGLTSGLYVYALSFQPGSRWRYATVLSKPFQATLLVGQPTFLLASMVTLPWTYIFAAIKPNIAAAVVAANPKWRAIITGLLGGIALLGVSLVLQPHWPLEWLDMVRADPYRRSALSQTGGFLLLLAALRWRRPEARLLLALAIVPQTLGMYDGLLLFAIPRRASEFIALVVISHFAFLMTFFDPSLTKMDAYVAATAAAVTHWLFLPTLLMVLWRPNVGVVPAPVERLMSRAPRWLRGQPLATAA
jgi:hypothetical protein